MKKIIFVIFMISTAVLFAQVTETASLKAFIYGSTNNATAYDNYVSHIAEGIASPNYNLYAPFDRQTNGFGNYRVPTPTDLSNWNNVLTAFFMGNMVTTQIYLNNYNFPYEVVTFTDTDTDRTYHILRETLDDSFTDDNGTAGYSADDETGSFNYSWGLYIYNPNATKPIIITAPHPNDDFVTAPLATKCFQDWDARYYLISGAGREVKWTNSGSYYNSKSLCDASRNASTAYHYFYKRACDEIRSTFNTREFSAQIHSYDWNRHENYPSLQVSAGNGKNHIGLPIRDLSTEKNDLINNTNLEVFAENSIGIHPMVYFNEDYYGINYNDGDFYVNYNGEQVQVSNHIDLPGYSRNKQMEYTCSGFNDYDVYEPFFHVEFDELPNTYAQTENNYKWFYGFDFETNRYDRTKLFEKSFEFYSPWIDGMTASLSTIWVDDTNNPTAPSNLSYFAADNNSATLNWDRAYDYDFSSYEVLYSTEPIANNNYSTFSRSNDPKLAAQNITTTTVTGLTANQTYYAAVRAIDKLGNLSDISNEITFTTGCAQISDVVVLGNNGNVSLNFKAVVQSSNQGFYIDRSDNEEGPFTRISDYTTNTDLVANNAVSNVVYNYIDTDVVNNNTYYYRIGAVSTDDVTMEHKSTFGANPQIIWDLKFEQAGNQTTNILFGKNKYAEDVWDDEFDEYATLDNSAPYLNAAVYETYYNNEYYVAKHIKADYDEVNDSKYWKVRVNSSAAGTPITISIDNLPTTRNAERLYAYGTFGYVDLTQDNLTITPANSNWVEFYVFWGNIVPDITMGNSPNLIIRPGDSHTFTWSVYQNLHRSVIDHFEFYAVETDYREYDVDYYELPLSTNIPASSNSFAFTAPVMPAWGYKMVGELRAIMAQGDTLVFRTPYTFKYIPNNVTVSPDHICASENNWMMNSFPFEGNNAPTASEVFGANSIHKTYNFGTGLYEDAVNLSYDTAFWSYLPDTGNYTVNNFPTLATEASIAVYQGWNLVGNPHMGYLDTKTLRIKMPSENTLDFAEAIANDYIEPVIYNYNNGYQTADIIYPFSSFWIYVNAPMAEVVFSINHENGSTFEATTDWSLEVKANQAGTDADRVVLAASKNATEGIDKLYDYRKPPVKPFVNQVNLSAYHSFLGAPFTKYHQSTIDGLSAEEADSYTWVLKLNTTQQISTTISAELAETFPANYGVTIVNGTESFDLRQGDYVFTPSTEETTLELVVENNVTNANGEVNQVNKITCTNYPNPFNPSTFIQFNLPQKANVNLTVYNVKGQKVKTLVNGEQQQGSQTIEWKGKNSHGNSVASGVYFYRLNVKNQKTITKKMLLLK